ncbi:hypothetical protein T12_1462 [Trichinella patagoniensis]|uniref:Uncharacterized protein n=1 Tax=Trichinella patagoniensis TaxID=990121 RepID=A0A0V0ZZQ4_9BILA|nr:hypothetical protein T12_1462 [Trichinella patagoniensis]
MNSEAREPIVSRHKHAMSTQFLTTNEKTGPKFLPINTIPGDWEIGIGKKPTTQCNQIPMFYATCE